MLIGLLVLGLMLGIMVVIAWLALLAPPGTSAIVKTAENR